MEEKYTCGLLEQYFIILITLNVQYEDIINFSHAWTRHELLAIFFSSPFFCSIPPLLLSNARTAESRDTHMLTHTYYRWFSANFA